MLQLLLPWLLQLLLRLHQLRFRFHYHMVPLLSLQFHLFQQQRHLMSHLVHMDLNLHLLLVH